MPIVGFGDHIPHLVALNGPESRDIVRLPGRRGILPSDPSLLHGINGNLPGRNLSGGIPEEKLTDLF
jgi:hypothetical protein